ncbi:UNVERIFIED_CONTAM: hypothetical protein FKN15_055870 [Acipenser sinensis]
MLSIECYTANGEDYRGKQNQTCLHGGKPCLYWNETFQHPYNTMKYPNGEGSKAMAGVLLGSPCVLSAASIWWLLVSI